MIDQFSRRPVGNNEEAGRREAHFRLPPAAPGGEYAAMLHDLLDLVLHIDKHLEGFARENGPLIYALLFAIIFCETGLVVTPFLPGDSLLFAVGALAGLGLIQLPIVIPLLIGAAILGDNLNYWIGRKSGQWMVGQRWFKHEYLEKTERFFLKYGPKAIVLARFVPIVRTFAPFTAGFGRMNYGRFLAFSIGGGVFWVTAFSLAGYLLGNIPVVRANLKIAFLLIIVISLIPVAIEFIRHRKAPKQEDAEGQA